VYHRCAERGDAWVAAFNGASSRTCSLVCLVGVCATHADGRGIVLAGGLAWWRAVHDLVDSDVGFGTIGV
jgi:hypothetical protein